MKRAEIGIPGISISIPIPDDIETNAEARKAFLEEQKDDIMLLAFANAIFDPSGKTSTKMEIHEIQ